MLDLDKVTQTLKALPQEKIFTHVLVDFKSWPGAQPPHWEVHRDCVSRFEVNTYSSDVSLFTPGGWRYNLSDEGTKWWRTEEEARFALPKGEPR